MRRALYIYFNQLCTSRRTKLLTEYRRGEEEQDQRPPDLEGARRGRLVVAQPEEADDNEEVDDLLRVAFDIENEGVRNVWRRCDDHDDLFPSAVSTSLKFRNHVVTLDRWRTKTHGGYQVDNQARQGGLARRPVRCPEAAPEWQRDALLRKFWLGCRSEQN